LSRRWTPLNADKVTTELLDCFCFYIGVYLRLSRSNVRLPTVSRIINYEEPVEVIGTGFICG
jgi:hypothetical protein